MTELGPLGTFPDGMSAPDDTGAIRIAISKDHKGNVRIDFGGECTWFAMSPAEAIEFANIILKRAREK